MNQPARVLVVDGDPDRRRAAGRWLAQAGYDVRMAATGAEGCRLAAEQPPDLVLLDAALPGDAAGEIARLKQEPALAGALVAWVCGPEAMPGPTLPDAESGADDWIVRPGSRQELLARVRSMLRTQRLQAELRQRTDELAEHRAMEERIQSSLQEKEVLLKEIHHRVKNNLQVISSLLDMQSLSTKNPTVVQALQDSRDRVRTMAYVHERLYQSDDLASIDVAEYVASLTGHLMAVYEDQAAGVDLRVDVDRVYLDLDTAIPCGLVINELVSNALKYAFSPGRAAGGEVRVGFYARGDGRLELVVADNGAGLPPEIDPRQTQSLGLRLVQMLVRQIGGELEVDRQGGTAFRISFVAPGGKAR